ncbi:MAG: aminotransferase class I/II-fold pyridoxal phosphate-dependent enzyme [Gaiellales bacterium]
MPESPLADAVDRFLADPGTTFTVPGHKRSPELADALLQLDLPLVSGADDSRMTGDVLGRAERLAAGLWGADMCRFSVSGSTHGNQAFALAVARPGDRVIVARTLHKSLHAGLVLAGLEPVWVRPQVDATTGLSLGVPAAAVELALAEAPDARAVFLVEPSYIGRLSDIEAIAEVTHAAGVPLMVDQAWGAHLGFHPALPKHAIARGADGMVTSTHKNLTAFTQGSIVLARGERIDLARLDECFELLHTTSPSAAIMASSDRARALVEERGPELLGRTIEIVADASRRLSQVEGLTVVDADDPTKLVLALAGTGADGFEVERDLLGRGIRLEMADRDTLVPIVTLADTAETVGRLADGVADSVAARRGEPRPPASSTVWSLVAEVVMSPRDAYFAPRRRVAWREAVGRIAAETAAPYPPGIPALAPGELISQEILGALRAEAAAGSRMAYCSDPTLETLLVVDA